MMANPKKGAPEPADARRTHWKLKLVTLSRCDQCQAPRLPHHACPSCGSYRGRKVMEVEA